MEKRPSPPLGKADFQPSKQGSPPGASTPASCTHGGAKPLCAVREPGVLHPGGQGKGGQRLEPFAERPWGSAFVWATVIALIFVARPNFPINQMPQ
jgi:hypothetical protein